MREFLFLTDIYDTRWAGFRFYASMMDEIRAIVEAEGHRATAITTLDSTTARPGHMVMLDNAALISLAREGNLEALLDHEFLLIIGESVDQEHGGFVDWHLADYLRPLKLEPGNILWRIIEKADKVTWQDRVVRDLLLRARPAETVVFFPVNGYKPSHVIPPWNDPPDIDILFYGVMAYERRADFARTLLLRGTDMSIVVACNVYEPAKRGAPDSSLDHLLARSRIVLHVNSFESASTPPYAKIMKPLANNKILFVERGDALADTDLLPFIETFELDDLDGLFARLRDVLDRFEERQRSLMELRPRDWLESHYDFEANVVSLLGLDHS